MDNGILSAIILATGTVVASVWAAYVKIYKPAKLEKEQCLQDKRNEPVKLIYHSIFTAIREQQCYVDRNFKLDSPGKTELVKVVLNYRLEVVYKTYMHLAGKITKDWDTTRLVNAFHDAISDTIKEFNSLPDSMSLSNEEKITVEIFIKKFELWDESRFQRKIYAIDRVGVSAFHPDPISKASVIFYIYNALIADMVFDAEDAMKEINGDLNGQVFRGYLIGGNDRDRT